MARLKLYYPIKPTFMNQPFAVNGDYYRKNGINIIGHNGNDFRAFHGQPVYATHDGVAFYEQDDSAGQGVVIVSDKAYEYYPQGRLDSIDAYFKTIYWHLCDPRKEPRYASPVFLFTGGANNGRGVRVRAGDIIGYADSTGLSTGDHLHFGLKPILPGHAYLEGDAPDIGIGEWVNVEQNNGYLGAIDPSPYWNRFYASDAQLVISMLSSEVALLQRLVNLIKIQSLKSKS